jgi:2,3-dihydroxybenzoate-AMP ligase
VTGLAEARPALAGHVPIDAARAERYRRLGLWCGRTVPGIVEAAAARWPTATALIDGERTLGYAVLAAGVDRLAAQLLRLGLQPRERVVLQLPNSLEFVLTYLALMRIGTIPVMALRAHREREVGHFLAASGAVAYVVPGVHGGFDFRAMAAALAPRAPALRDVLVLDDPLPGQRSLRALIDAGDRETAHAPGDGQPAAQTDGAHRPAPTDVATMLLSGGTTSISKLIPRTHEDYALNAHLCAVAAGFGRDTVLLAVLPLAHNYTLASPGMLGAFSAGGTVVLSPGTDADTVFGLVERHRATVIPAAVPLITQWLHAGVERRFDLASLRVVQNGGARLAPELRQRVRAQWRCTPQEIYGTAEGLINMTRLDDPDELLLESSGAPVSEADEIRVVDDQGRDVPDGEPGELITRGPYTIAGYFAAPQADRDAFTADGFYRMGDIVRKRGRHLFAEGRRKDLINRGGEKISCEEVENLMLRHPAVEAVSLVAMPDPVFGERACAVVVPIPGAQLDLPQLVAFLRAQGIASFKLPERLECVERLPTSPVGKVMKRELREWLAQRVAGEAGAAPGRGAGAHGTGG